MFCPVSSQRCRACLAPDLAPDLYFWPPGHGRFFQEDGCPTKKMLLKMLTLNKFYMSKITQIVLVSKVILLKLNQNHQKSANNDREDLW
jgi:hypothetical protein